MLNEQLQEISEKVAKGPVKCIFIHQHLGLGDHIVCNGLTREIMNQESDADYFFMPVKFHNLSTVAKMYSDDKRITLLPVQGDWNEIYNLPQVKFCSKIYLVGHYKTRKDWDISFYDSIGIPFEKRWTSFKIDRDYETEKTIENQLNPDGEPFILIHDTASWGTCPLETRKDLKIIRVTPITGSLTDWCGLIEKAEEVHCIDSSFIHLCTSMGREGTFHDFNKDSSWGAHFVMPQSWTMKKYNNTNGISVPFTV